MSTVTEIAEPGRPLLLACDEKRIFCTATETKVRLGKGKPVSIKPIIGAPYGSTFAYDPELGSLKMIVPKGRGDEDDDTAINAEASGTDNRNLRDLNTSQGLSHQEIEKLKEEGASAEDLVKKLVENSATFSGKTVFAKEKYIRRKKKKHQIVVESLYPNTHNIAEATYIKDSFKICFMRPDCLARMLQKACLHSGIRAMVCETCSGLVTCSVAERIGNVDPSGIVYNVQMNVNVTKQIPTKSTQFVKPLSAIENVSVYPMLTALQEGRFECDPSVVPNAAESLIVATKYDPVDVTVALLPYLMQSGTFVVYSQCLRQLEDLAEVVLGTVACDIDISESWMREYQVLPQRTHPMMEMNGASGYILSGTKIEPDYDALKRGLMKYRSFKDPVPKKLPKSENEN